MSASGQWLTNECVCGSKGGSYLSHYEIMRCKCGRLFWALQPKRQGPLKLYPHPGFGDRRITLIPKIQK